MKSDGLFYWERHVVLLKTTRRFFPTHVFFLDNVRKMKEKEGEAENKVWKIP